MNLRAFISIAFINFTLLSSAQNFLNGDFENNSALDNMVNLSSDTFNVYMDDCNSFGYLPNLDIITTAIYNGGPQSGNWYVGVTSGETDRLSMKLSDSLEIGQGYTITFWDKCDLNPMYSNGQERVEISLSMNDNTIDTTIYTCPYIPEDGQWNQRMCTFVAPIEATNVIVTLNMDSINPNTPYGYWTHIDNFSIDTCTMNLQLPNDTTLCEINAPLTINPIASSGNLQWSTGETSNSIQVNQDGIYSVELQSTCGVLYDTIVVNFVSSPEVNLIDDTTLCAGDSLVLIESEELAFYTWNTGSNDSVLTVTESGLYTLEVTNQCGTDMDIANVTFYEYPQFDLNASTPLCLGENVLVDFTVSAQNWLWSNGSTSDIIYPDSSNWYGLIAWNGPCASTDSISINVVNCNLELQMPNVFTPDGDGTNDIFSPIVFEGISNAELLILNRWGVEVYRSINVFSGWNGIIAGEPAASGVYFWMVKGQDLLGVDYIYSGSVSLIR